MLGFLKLIGLVVALVLSPYYWEKSRRSLAVRLIVAAGSICLWIVAYVLDGAKYPSLLIFYPLLTVLAHVFAEIRRRKAAKAEQAAPSDEPEA